MSPDGILTAWRSADGLDWQRALLALAIRQVGILLPFRDGLALTANGRGTYGQSSALDIWMSRDGLAWRRTGTLRLTAPPQFESYRQLVHGPWVLGDRLVVMETYATQQCCGGGTSTFLAAHGGRARSQPEYHSFTWTSRDGRHWTRQHTRDLDGRGGEHLGYRSGRTAGRSWRS